MNWIYFGIFLGILLLYRWIQKKAYHLTYDDLEPFVWAQSPEMEATVVIAGNTPLADALVELFEANHVSCWRVGDASQINQSAFHRCLLAVSDSDTDNLLVSRIGTRRMQYIEMQYLLCNEAQNEPLFRQTGQPYWCIDAPDVGEIYEMVSAWLFGEEEKEGTDL